MLWVNAGLAFQFLTIVLEIRSKFITHNRYYLIIALLEYYLNNLSFKIY